MKGRLYLVPAPLDFGCAQSADLRDTLPMATLTVAAHLTHWVCENAKTTRAYLKRVGAVQPLAAPLQALDGRVNTAHVRLGHGGARKHQVHPRFYQPERQRLDFHALARGRVGGQRRVDLAAQGVERCHGVAAVFGERKPHGFAGRPPVGVEAYPAGKAVAITSKMNMLYVFDRATASRRAFGPDIGRSAATASSALIWPAPSLISRASSRARVTTPTPMPPPVSSVSASPMPSSARSK